MPINYPGDGATFPTTISIPVNGEAINERNCAPAWKKNADRSAYLERIAPKLYTFTTDNTPSAYWTYGNSTTLETTAATGGYVDVPDCEVGDKIVVAGSLSFVRTENTTKEFDAYLEATDGYGSLAPGAQTHIPGAHYDAAAGIIEEWGGFQLALCLNGTWTVAAAGTTRITFGFISSELSDDDDDVFQVWRGFNISAILMPVP